MWPSQCNILAGAAVGGAGLRRSEVSNQSAFVCSAIERERREDIYIFALRVIDIMVICNTFSFPSNKKIVPRVSQEQSKTVSSKHSIQDRIHTFFPPLPFLAHKCIDHCLRSLLPAHPSLVLPSLAKFSLPSQQPSVSHQPRPRPRTDHTSRTRCIAHHEAGSAGRNACSPLC